ncbi:acyl carrier protein [Oleiphilus messinensis]|uniref:Acyl carrier protein n=1 Tax=Oleiphilus messinensis TaxID=141451 RepID=A0A1Y0I4F2_9GAMM|nr:phosphopantetheine-binding protein [Oleiphilus messinensis]ARU55120.1 acyl carrier protein [Oleiphilus messinensis]
MEQLKNEIKELIIQTLDLEDTSPEDIVDDEPLFIEGLGLDSIDALELGLAIKKSYNIKLDPDSEVAKQHFASVNSLASFVKANFKSE